jgi:hypothetical protein
MNVKTTFAIFATLAGLGLASIMVAPLLQMAQASRTLPNQICNTPGEDHTDPGYSIRPGTNTCYN